MQAGEQSGSGIGIAVVAWVAVFSAAWAAVTAFTGASGLALVWGVFLALLGFELSRTSFRRGLFIIFLSLFVILLRGVYSLFI